MNGEMSILSRHIDIVQDKFSNFQVKTGNIRNARTKGRVRAAHFVKILPFCDDDCEAEYENGGRVSKYVLTIIQLIVM